MQFAARTPRIKYKSFLGQLCRPKNTPRIVGARCARNHSLYFGPSRANHCLMHSHNTWTLNYAKGLRRHTLILGLAPTFPASSTPSCITACQKCIPWTAPWHLKIRQNRLKTHQNRRKTAKKRADSTAPAMDAKSAFNAAAPENGTFCVQIVGNSLHHWFLLLVNASIIARAARVRPGRRATRASPAAPGIRPWLGRVRCPCVRQRPPAPRPRPFAS